MMGPSHRLPPSPLRGHDVRLRMWDRTGPVGSIICLSAPFLRAAAKIDQLTSERQAGGVRLDRFRSKRRAIGHMDYRMLGRTGIKASVVGFGAWGIGGGMWQDSDDERALAALAAAL